MSATVTEEATAIPPAPKREPTKYSLDWWAAERGISKRTLYNLISTRQLRATKYGKRTVVLPLHMQQYDDAHRVGGGK